MSEIENIAKQIVAKGKGILAADESTGTMTKRLSSVNVKSTLENRLKFRETLFSAEGIKNFIGGDVYTLGFPEGKGLNQYLDEFISYCFEIRGRMANGHYKDDGVDVIGFKLFGDGRSANLYILLQCAAGIHWRTKKEIKLSRWTQYIFWYPECIISSISTVDFVSQKDWEKQTSSFGMLIDRVRIYNTLYQTNVEESLRNEVLAWAKPTLN